MAIYVKGTAVENAERYTLYEKSGETYTALTTGTEINFALDGLGLAAGDHVLVVKARADGYTDSEYSNEVTYTVEDVEGVTWLSLPVTRYSLGVTSTGTGRAGSTSTRFSTADPDTANGILIPAGKTIHLRGLASGTYPLRFDYLYGTGAGPNPAGDSTTAIEGLVGIASNYNSANYFPCNAEGNDVYDLTNSYGEDYYFFFGFAGLNKTEEILNALGTYTLQYYIA